MKNLIAATTLVLASVVSAPAIAGEAYVRNTDSYSRGATYTNVQFQGAEIYNGVEKNYSYANKFRYEGGRGEYSYQYSGGSSSDLKLYGGFDSYRGVQTGYEVNKEYSHEVAGGTR